MRVSILLSDPWDLGEALGWPRLWGVVRQEERDERGGRALIQLEEPLHYNGAIWRFFVAQPRLAGDTTADLRDGKEVFVNCTGVSDRQAASDDPMDTSWWRGGGLAFLATLDPSS